MSMANTSGTETPSLASFAGAGLDPLSILRAAVRYKWLVLLILVAAPSLAGLYASQLPKEYEAVAKLEYDPTPPRPLGREIEEIADPVSSYWAGREWYATQNKIIASRTVAERVVRQLALHQDRSFLGIPSDAPFKPVSVQSVASILQGRTTVKQEENTRLVQVRVRDGDPERAQLLANTISHTFVEKTVEDRMGSTVNALDWLNRQLERQKRELGDSELALHEFKESNNVLALALESRQNLVARDIEHYSEALTAAQLEIIGLKARLEELESIDVSNPLTLPPTTSDEESALATLRQEYRTALATRRTLGVRYGERHPEIEATVAKLEALREQIREEVHSAINATSSALRAAQTRAQMIKASLERAHQAGLELNRHEIEYRKLQRAQANNEKLYSLLLQRTTETNLTRLIQLSHVRLLEPALKPGVPIRPRISIFVMSGLAAGLLLSIGLVLTMARLDNTIKSVEELESFGVTVMGVLPTVEHGGPIAKMKKGSRSGLQERLPATPATPRDLLVYTHPRSVTAECSRAIRTNLTFMSADRPLGTLMVTSASPLEGKTTLAINLAVTLAQSGKRVLLVDTDLRRPRLHRTFGLKSKVGVTSLLVGECELDAAVQQTQIDGLWLLPCGPIPPNPSELLHSVGFQRFLEDAQHRFDRVILDSPPLGVVTDAAVMAPQVAGTLLVVQGEQTTRPAVQAALRALRDVNAHLVGAVMNFVELASQRSGYQNYYYYGSGEYSSSDDDDGEAERPQPSITA